MMQKPAPATELTLADFKPGDLVEVARIKNCPTTYKQRMGVGAVVGVSRSRVVVQWPRFRRPRPYAPGSLMISGVQAGMEYTPDVLPTTKPPKELITNMKYRTTLTDPKGTKDRPTQAFHPHMQAAHDWAKATLAASSPEAYITLYLEVEVQVWSWKQPASTPVIGTRAPGTPLEGPVGPVGPAGPLE